VNTSDARILWQMLIGQPARGTHAEKLQAFYAPQATRYDDFRERLLKGRKELIDNLATWPGARVVELGGGTGRNLLFFGDRLKTLGRVDLVDLCPALLEQARVKTSSMANVHITEADAVTWKPEEPADIVYLSYALTMIPDWKEALDNAFDMLKPGGILGVTDFYVSAAEHGPGRVRHNAFDRWFWPRWFRHDGVRLNPEHLHYLVKRLPTHQLREHVASVPYLAGLKVPYYVFTGQKPGFATVNHQTRKLARATSKTQSSTPYPCISST
jgi:S-adenosylmethionine-diacylgycerolhomoserine-N-methlytransferase